MADQYDYGDYQVKKRDCDYCWYQCWQQFSLSIDISSIWRYQISYFTNNCVYRRLGVFYLLISHNTVAKSEKRNYLLRMGIVTLAVISATIKSDLNIQKRIERSDYLAVFTLSRRFY